MVRLRPGRLLLSSWVALGYPLGIVRAAVAIWEAKTPLHRARALKPGRLLNAQKLHLEHQRAVRRDLRAGAVRAVSEVRGNLELELVPHLHELEALGPAGTDSVQRETDWLSAFHGTVEHCAVEQGAVVMHFHGIRAFRRHGSVTLFHYL